MAGGAFKTPGVMRDHGARDEDELLEDASHDDLQVAEAAEREREGGEDDGDEGLDPAAQEKAQQEQRISLLDTLGATLAKTRSEAISGRFNCGIELNWLEDQDAYEGIDDANRAIEHAAGRHRWRKPTTLDVAMKDEKAKEKAQASRSVAFLNITGPYVDAGAARVADMLLPNDEACWELNPTPIPELTQLAEMGEPANPAPIAGMVPGAPAAAAPGATTPPQGASAPPQAPSSQGIIGSMVQQAAPAASNVAAQPGIGAQAPVEQQDPELAELLKYKEQAEAAIEKARKGAKLAQTRIEDWLAECQWNNEARKAIDDAARLGTGVLKGPFPVEHKALVWDPQSQTLIVKKETKPASVRVDPWNFYPDPACGENIHRGGYTWERDDITAKTLRDLRTAPGYIDFQIDRCLSEGPQAAIVSDGSNRPDNGQAVADGVTFEIWYYHGFVTRQDLEASGLSPEDLADLPNDEHLAIPAVITMVNERVIKAHLNPLDDGSFPYDLMVWKELAGMPWGEGIARQLRTPQRMLNAATRNMLDNAALSAGPQIIMIRGIVHPADGRMELVPRKLWVVEKDKVAEAKHAFTSVNIECMQEQLLALIEFALRMAEQVTGMPALVQGQQGDAPDILGVVTILNNNASSVLRRIARIFDCRVTEPQIGRYFNYLLAYGENAEEKGVYVVQARGSSVLVERDLNSQTLVNMGQMALNPAFGVDPRKYFAELCKAQRLDPLLLQYSDAEWKRLQEAAADGPQDPRIAVAQMRAELDERLAAAEMHFNEVENARDRQLQLVLKTVDKELAGAQIGSKQKETLDRVRATLAGVAIKERSANSRFEKEAQLRRTTGEGI